MSIKACKLGLAGYVCFLTHGGVGGAKLYSAHRCASLQHEVQFLGEKDFENL
jgi:hypothetical protein